MGHEAAGEVVEFGNAVQGYQTGDRVTFDSTVSCGKCSACRQGRINLCQNRQVLGVSCDEFRRDGAFAEYVVVPQQIVYRLPDRLPFEHAALIESVSIAVHAASRAPIRLGSTGVVIGAGMIGLLVIQALKQAGCSKVIAVDLDATRLAKAKMLGADVVVHSASDETVAAILETPMGEGRMWSWKWSRSQSTVTSAIFSAKRGGHVVLVGNLSPKVEVPLKP